MGYALPAPGDVIATKYVVESTLGQGGMGMVYAVRHRITDKRLALKCLLPERAANPHIARRFLREAQAAGRIQHRYVVDVVDAGTHDGLSFIVMEFLEGTTLSRLLEDSSLSLEQGLSVILRAMEGVAAAHAGGVIHRDLKPDNIFVCTGTSGRLDDPRVLDFGISKFDDGFSPLTSTGPPMGTPYYMSLEQLRGVRDLDARVDVYAMGVVLYEALAGRPPYVAENMSVLAIQVLTAEPVPLLTLRPDLPAGLCAVVMKALARDREDRYPSMRALIEALLPFAVEAQREPPEARAPLRPARALGAGAMVTTAAAQPVPRSDGTALAQQRMGAGTTPEPISVEASVAPRTRRPAWIAAATALLLIAGGVAWYLRRGAGVGPVRPAAQLTPAAPAGAPALAVQPPATTARSAASDVTSTANTSPMAAPREVPQRTLPLRSRVRGDSAATKPVAPAPAAVSVPAESLNGPPPATRVQGRSGESMALDEF